MKDWYNPLTEQDLARFKNRRAPVGKIQIQIDMAYFDCRIYDDHPLHPQKPYYEILGDELGGDRHFSFVYHSWEIEQFPGTRNDFWEIIIKRVSKEIKGLAGHDQDLLYRSMMNGRR